MIKKILMTTIFSLMSISVYANIGIEPNNEKIKNIIEISPKKEKDVIPYLLKKDPELRCLLSNNNVTCGTISKLEVKENGSEVSLTAYGYSLIKEDSLKEAIFTNSQGSVKPKRILIENSINGVSYQEVNNGVLKNERVLAPGYIKISYIFRKSDFDSIENIQWDAKKLFTIIDNKSNKEFTLPNKISENYVSIIVKSKGIDFAKENNSNPDKNETGLTKIEVYRKLNLNYPPNLTTQVRVSSDKNKKINLGKIIPEGSILMTVSKENLIEQINGDYWLSVNKGINNLELLSALKNINDFNTKDLINGNSQEFWFIQQNNNNYIISGVEGMNAENLNVNNSWRKYPVFLVKDSISLEKQVENESVLTGELVTNVKRVSYFNKEGDISSWDTMELKNANNIQRKLVQKESTLTEANILGLKLNDKEQVVLESNKVAYVPLKGSSNVFVAHENNLKNNEVPVGVFEASTTINDWQVNILPRHRLFWSSQNIFYGTWLDTWNLYSIFFCILIAVAFWKLINWKISVLSSVTIILLSPMLGILIWGWWIIFLIIFIFSKFYEKRKIGVVSVFSFIFLLTTISCVVLNIRSEVQYMINPSLETKKDNFNISNLMSNENYYSADMSAAPASAPMVETDVLDEDFTQEKSTVKKIGSSSIVKPAMIREDFKPEVIRSFQVIKPIPEWSNNPFKYYNYSNIQLRTNIESDSLNKVSFTIIKPWLVNLIGILQMGFMLLLLSIGLIITLLLAPNMDLRERVKNSRFYEMFLKN